MFVDKKEPQVTSLFELVAIMIATFALLYLFAPKKQITQAINAENTNYDLTLTYLESIAKSDPLDEKNWEILIHAYLNIGKYQKASSTFKEHLADNPAYLSLSYEILKTRWLNSPKGQQKKAFNKALQQTMHRLLAYHDKTLYAMVEEDAQRFNFPHIRYKAMKKRLLAQSFHTPAQLLSLYDLAVGIHQADDALAFLHQQFQRTPSKELGIQLAKRYAQNQAYEKAASLYQTLYTRYHDSAFFLASVEHYFYAKKKKEAFRLLDKEAKNFYHDDVMSQKIITLYLAHGFTQKARTYTLAQLQKRGIL